MKAKMRWKLSSAVMQPGGRLTFWVSAGSGQWQMAVYLHKPQPLSQNLRTEQSLPFGTRCDATRCATPMPITPVLQPPSSLP